MRITFSTTGLSRALVSRATLLHHSHQTLLPITTKTITTTPQYRFRSTSAAAPSAPSSSSSQAPATASLSPRWLSDLKSRIGKCILFGLSGTQTLQAGEMLKEIARDWRELVAGSEGFLTARERRGLWRQEVVWGEMDSMVSHVNNVTYNRYAESARVNWAQKYATHIDPAHKKEWSELCTPRGIGLILRSIKTDYKFPMTWPDHISVYHKLGQEPHADTDSFILDVLILSERHQRPAARCVEDIVVYDYKRAKKTPLEPFMVDTFRETWRLQQEAKQRYSDRVRELLERVKQLEQQSWDRPDAKEDLGSAAAGR